jgi:hypothetical protein
MRPQSNLVTIPECLEAEENHEITRQYRPCPGRESNQEPLNTNEECYR